MLSFSRLEYERIPIFMHVWVNGEAILGFVGQKARENEKGEGLLIGVSLVQYQHGSFAF